MADELSKAMTALARRLIGLAARDEALLSELRSLAGAFLLETAEPTPREPVEPAESATDVTAEARSEPESAPLVEGEAAAVAVPPSGQAAPSEPRQPAPPLPKLTLGSARPLQIEAQADPIPAGARATADDDLSELEARCRLKAEGARWATARRRRLAGGAEFRDAIAPKDREILEKARQLPDCFLWMNTPNFHVPDDPAPLEAVAGCFDAVADAVRLVRATRDERTPPEWFEQAIQALAEAQSALRVAVGRFAAAPDSDQFRAYNWLRETADREHVYISRHMRINDPADPAHLPAIVARIGALRAKVDGQLRAAKRKKSRVTQLRYHADRIGKGDGDEHDWRKLAEAVDGMVGDGVPPSVGEIREALMPILDLMPDLDPLPRGFELALREVDRFLATRDSPEGAPIAQEPSPEVEEVARLLAGRRAILIGGSRRPGAQAALVDSFGLEELHWIEGKAYNSVNDFEPFVARPRVALVLLAIRWSSHSFGDVKRFCDRYAKPLVRLPAGYNPNQVAIQILSQCSGQLRDR